MGFSTYLSTVYWLYIIQSNIINSVCFCEKKTWSLISWWHPRRWKLTHLKRTYQRKREKRRQVSVKSLQKSALQLERKLPTSKHYFSLFSFQSFKGEEYFIALVFSFLLFPIGYKFHLRRKRRNKTNHLKRTAKTSKNRTPKPTNLMHLLPIQEPMPQRKMTRDMDVCYGLIGFTYWESLKT